MVSSLLHSISTQHSFGVLLLVAIALREEADSCSWLQPQFLMHLHLCLKECHIRQTKFEIRMIGTELIAQASPAHAQSSTRA